MQISQAFFLHEHEGGAEQHRGFFAVVASGETFGLLAGSDAFHFFLMGEGYFDTVAAARRFTIACISMSNQLETIFMPN